MTEETQRDRSNAAGARHGKARLGQAWPGAARRGPARLGKVGTVYVVRMKGTELINVMPRQAHTDSKLPR